MIGLNLMEQILQLRSPSLVDPEGEEGYGGKGGVWPGRSRAIREGRRPDERPPFGYYAGARPWGDIVQPRSRPQWQPRDDPEERSLGLGS